MQSINFDKKKCTVVQSVRETPVNTFQPLRTRFNDAARDWFFWNDHLELRCGSFFNQTAILIENGVLNNNSLFRPDVQMFLNAQMLICGRHFNYFSQA